MEPLQLIYSIEDKAIKESPVEPNSHAAGKIVRVRANPEYETEKPPFHEWYIGVIVPTKKSLKVHPVFGPNCPEPETSWGFGWGGWNQKGVKVDLDCTQLELVQPDIQKKLCDKFPKMKAIVDKSKTTQDIKIELPDDQKNGLEKLYQRLYNECTAKSNQNCQAPHPRTEPPPPLNNDAPPLHNEVPPPPPEETSPNEIQAEIPEVLHPVEEIPEPSAQLPGQPPKRPVGYRPTPSITKRDRKEEKEAEMRKEESSKRDDNPHRDEAKLRRQEEPSKREGDLLSGKPPVRTEEQQADSLKQRKKRGTSRAAQQNADSKYSMVCRLTGISGEVLTGITVVGGVLAAAAFVFYPTMASSFNHHAGGNSQVALCYAGYGVGTLVALFSGWQVYNYFFPSKVQENVGDADPTLQQSESNATQRGSDTEVDPSKGFVESNGILIVVVVIILMVVVAYFMVFNNSPSDSGDDISPEEDMV